VDRTRDVTAAPIRAIADVDHDVVVQRRGELVRIERSPSTN
jgi:hypothetical protein